MYFVCLTIYLIAYHVASFRLDRAKTRGDDFAYGFWIGAHLVSAAFMTAWGIVEIVKALW